MTPSRSKRHQRLWKRQVESNVCRRCGGFHVCERCGPFMWYECGEVAYLYLPEEEAESSAQADNGQ